MDFLAWLYGMIMSIRNTLYDKGLLRVKEVKDVEIICVGNITVGGTGKTPGVQFFVKKLQKMGKKVAVVSRGYKGKRDIEPLLVSDGIKIFATTRESGDEPYIHALNLKVPIVVSKDRYLGCQFVKKHFDIDTIVLDDGFQHRKLKRDRDIILIDATNPYGWGEVLPIGTLREDFVRACKRATEFIITKSDLVAPRDVIRIKRNLQKLEKKNVSIAKHGVTSLVDIKGNRKPLFWVKDKRVLLFSGLANPLNFEKTVISLNPKYIERIDFIDHHDFTDGDFEKIRNRAEAMKADYIITTEKDYVKLPSYIEIKNLLILKIEFTMLKDNSLLPVSDVEDEGEN